MPKHGEFEYESYALPRWRNAEGTAIDCRLLGVKTHGKELGELPFLAADYDVEGHGREIFETIKANQVNVPIEPFIPEPPPKPLTMRQAATKRVMTPGHAVEVICASMPELDGHYRVGAGAAMEMNTIVTHIAAGLGFPSGEDTLVYHDKDGKTHAWPEDKFMAYVKAVSRYKYQLKHAANGTGDVLPEPVINLD